MKKELFNELLDSVGEAGKIRAGDLPASRTWEYSPLDIKAMRTELGLSQSRFAQMIGVSQATLQNWEQGRRVPEGPARALLRVVEKNPQAVLDALGG